MSSGLSSAARHRFGDDIIAALITSVIAIAYCLSYGALIFAGSLSSHVSYGISSMLITSAVSGLVVAASSSFYFAIAGADTNATAVLAAVAATIAREVAGDHDGAAHTILASLIASAIVGGGVLFLLGYFRVGHWVRFIPYPIVAGFLAATGWLLVNGALVLVTGISIFRPHAHAMSVMVLAQLLASIVVASALFATRRMKNPMLVPSILVGSGIVIDAALVLSYGSLAAARKDAWLVAMLGRPEFAPAWNPATFRFVHWSLLVTLLPQISTAIGVATIAILFGAAGLEVQSGIDADLDRELRSSGIASIAAGLFGGSIGVLSSSRSLANTRAGAKSRLSGVLVGLASLGALLGGSSAVSMIPRPLLGGLLLFLGFSLLYDWLIASWRHVSRFDTMLIVAIVVITAADGFFAALIVGLISACINFAIRYSRHRVIRHSLNGSNRRSRVERSARDSRILSEQGEQTCILRLQGYVFFGTAHSVLEEVRSNLITAGREHVRYLVLDFESVTGFDSSAAHSFAKIEQLATSKGTKVVYCAVSPNAYTLLERAGIAFLDGCDQNAFTDLDHALEWCEDRLLLDLAAESESLEDWLASELGGSDLCEHLLIYFEDVEVQAGEYLFHQGDRSDSVYLVADGRLCVVIDSGGGDRRLRSMVRGSFIGEMGLFSNEPRSASVIAEQDASVYRLTASAVERMADQEPALANAFHALLFRLAAERLRFASAEITALQA